MMQKPLSGTLDHQEFLRMKNRNNGNPGENTPESPPRPTYPIAASSSG